jgi:uncharacterized protein YdhG (YjbR/CyaY superfamily)
MRHDTFKELAAAIQSVASFESTKAYGMPAFRYKTKIVCCYMQCKNHVGLYPYSGKIINQFKTELKGLKTSKGAVQFPNNTKCAKGVVKKIIKALMKEIEAYLRKKQL